MSAFDDLKAAIAIYEHKGIATVLAFAAKRLVAEIEKAELGERQQQACERTLPKNPNVRQPYSDVFNDLKYYIGQIVEFLGVSKAEMGDGDWNNLIGYCKRLDQALLRAEAVLDPKALSDKEWDKANILPQHISITEEKKNE